MSQPIPDEARQAVANAVPLARIRQAITADHESGVEDQVTDLIMESVAAAVPLCIAADLELLINECAEKDGYDEVFVPVEVIHARAAELRAMTTEPKEKQ